MVSYWEPGPVPNFRDEGSSENRTRLKSGITKFAVRERGPTGAPLRSVEPTHSLAQLSHGSAHTDGSDSDSGNETIKCGGKWGPPKTGPQKFTYH